MIHSVSIFRFSEKYVGGCRRQKRVNEVARHLSSFRHDYLVFQKRRDTISLNDMQYEYQ